MNTQIFALIQDRLQFSYPNHNILWKEDDSINSQTGILFIDTNNGFSVRLLLDTDKETVVIKNTKITINDTQYYILGHVLEDYLTNILLKS